MAATRQPLLWPIADAIARVRQRLAAVASTLIAGLMLAQDGQLMLQQDRTWQAIRVERVDGKDVATAP